jgi:hypothetical protein
MDPNPPSVLWPVERSCLHPQSAPRSGRRTGRADWHASCETEAAEARSKENRMFGLGIVGTIILILIILWILGVIG